MTAAEPSRWKDFVTGSLSQSALEVTFVKLHGDGSARSFYRVTGAGQPCVLIVNPDPPCHTGRGVDENETWVYVAGLLKKSGGDTPEVFGFDREAGLILCEDVGDRHLEDEVLQRGASSAWTEAAYGRLLRTLAAIQGDCARTFEPERTFNLVYDADFMYEVESLYFARHFLGNLCGIDHLPLHQEFRLLAETADEAVGERVMIIRDFQSRNIMYQEREQRLRILDFQGARLGPAAYDVASLLYDPYVPLSQALRDKLAAAYPSLLSPLAPVAAAAFGESYPLVAAHRVMQALGAYAKLGLADGKTQFLEHVPSGLASLRCLLAGEQFEKFPRLIQTVEALKPPLRIK